MPGDGDGDPMPGDGDGDPMPGDGDGDPMPGDGDGDPMPGDGDGDPMPGDGDGDEPPPPDPIGTWILAMDNPGDRLMKVDSATGESVELCAMPIPDNFPSLTFDLDGTLYGTRSNTSTLEIIDPCTCEVTEVGPTNTGTPGVTVNPDDAGTLYGLNAAEDRFLLLDKLDGMASEVGELGGPPFGFAGLTWSDEAQTVYMVETDSDSLFSIDRMTGEASLLTALSVPVTGIGIEWHAGTGELYLCTNLEGEGHLYTVDPQDGTMVEMGMGMGFRCNSIATPWTAIECVDEVPFN